MTKVFALFTGLFLVGGIYFSPAAAQQPKQMLVFEINGNHYKKRNYNKEGKLQSMQELVVGSLQKKTNSYRLPVELYSYNAKGQLQDSSKTTYSCEPDDRQVLLNAFSFTDHAKGREIKVNLKDTNALYPNNPGPDWQMKPVKFGLDIDNGLVGFLGGKSRITMKARQIAANDTLKTGQYQINTMVDIGVYVLGINVKSFEYRVAEIVDKDRGIVWQKFTSEDDGSYFVISLI